MNKILSNITLYKKPSKSSKVLGNFPEGTELKTIDEKPSLRFKESGKYIALHDIYSRYFGTTGGYLSFYTEKNDISTPLIKKGDIIEKLLIGNSDKGSGVILNNENRIPFFITLNNERAYAPILKYNVNLENFFLPITKTEYETWYFIEIEGTNLKGYIEGCPIARQNESCEMC